MNPNKFALIFQFFDFFFSIFFKIFLLFENLVTLVDMMPNAIIYSFLIFFPLIVKQITTEKANRVHDMFKLMGLNDLVNLLIHFLKKFSSIFSSLLLSIAFRIFLLTFHSKSISNPGLLWEHILDLFHRVRHPGQHSHVYVHVSVRTAPGLYQS